MPNIDCAARVAELRENMRYQRRLPESLARCTLQRQQQEIAALVDDAEARLRTLLERWSRDRSPDDGERLRQAASEQLLLVEDAQQLLKDVGERLATLPLQSVSANS